MQQQLVKTASLKNNTGQIKGLPKNPRVIRDIKFTQLKKSIEENPEMLSLRELIVYDYDNQLIVICGNMRLKAIKELGIKDVQVKILPQHTSVEKLRAYAIKDNIGYGEHDWDVLANEWDAAELEAWGLDIPGFDGEGELEQDDQGDEFTRLEVECKDPEQLNDLMDELHSRGFNVKAK